MPGSPLGFLIFSPLSWFLPCFHAPPTPQDPIPGYLPSGARVPRGKAGMSGCQEGQLWTGAWNEVAQEEWLGVAGLGGGGHSSGKRALWIEWGSLGERAGGGGREGVCGTFKGLGRGARQLPR